MALAIDPQTPATLYAGTTFGEVFNSTNGGITATFSSPDGNVFVASTSQFSSLAGRIERCGFVVPR